MPCLCFPLQTCSPQSPVVSCLIWRLLGQAPKNWDSTVLPYGFNSVYFIQISASCLQIRSPVGHPLPSTSWPPALEKWLQKACGWARTTFSRILLKVTRCWLFWCFSQDKLIDNLPMCHFTATPYTQASGSPWLLDSFVCEYNWCQFVVSVSRAACQLLLWQTDFNAIRFSFLLQCIKYFIAEICTMALMMDLLFPWGVQVGKNTRALAGWRNSASPL